MLSRCRKVRTTTKGGYHAAEERNGGSRTVNLLLDPVLSLAEGEKVSLPGLFAALARGEARGFPALRPHQRPAWHMFLVQLGALAAWNAPGEPIPEDETGWVAALRRLTPEHADDAPWRLAVFDGRKPAFLQPPAPEAGNAGRLNWRDAETPDALDMLITARNHDLKAAVARAAEAEDWVYALVSLQTCEGYGGAGNYGIARMNGGSSSRPMLGLASARAGEATPNPSAWWRRDVERLLAARNANGNASDPKPALLWCLEWPEGAQLRVEDLDPWFIEVCRRVRLDRQAGQNGQDERLVARRAASRKPRIAAQHLQGNTGDPWAPVHREEGKGLTLGSGDFDCRRLCELLFSGAWEVPLLCRAGSGESGPMLLVAEAFSRGNVRTEGFKSRTEPVPADMAPLLAPGMPAAVLADAQLGEIDVFDRALRDALATMAAGGRVARREHYRHGFATRNRFRRRADEFFFPSLWRRVRARAAEHEAKRAFLADLLREALAELEVTIPATSCPAALRPLAEARARRRFHNRLWGAYSGFLARELRDLSEREAGNGAIAAAARDAADMLAELAPGALAEARRGEGSSGSPAFRRLAGAHPETIGRSDRRAAWMAIVRILAVLAEGAGSAGIAPERRLGEALCDGGDAHAWPAKSGRAPHPVFSERRLAQLLAARGERRAVLLERAARALVRSPVPGPVVDPADIALALLAPEAGQLLAGPYHQRLDRARWDAGQDSSSEGAEA